MGEPARRGEPRDSRGDARARRRGRTRGAGRPELERPGRWGASRHRAYADLTIATSRPGSRTAASTISEIYASATSMSHRAERAALDRARWDEAGGGECRDGRRARRPFHHPTALRGSWWRGWCGRDRASRGSSEDWTHWTSALPGSPSRQGRALLDRPGCGRPRGGVAWLEGRRDAIPGADEDAAPPIVGGLARMRRHEVACGSSGGDGASAWGAIRRRRDGAGMPRRSPVTGGGRRHVFGPRSAAPTRRRWRSATPTTTRSDALRQGLTELLRIGARPGRRASSRSACASAGRVACRAARTGLRGRTRRI